MGGRGKAGRGGLTGNLLLRWVRGSGGNEGAATPQSLPLWVMVWAAPAGRTDSDRTGSVLFGAIRTEPVRTGPVRTGPVRTEPNRSEPDRSEPNRSERAIGGRCGGGEHPLFLGGEGGWQQVAEGGGGEGGHPLFQRLVEEEGRGQRERPIGLPPRPKNIRRCRR
jgi:hypothetical protein